MTFRPHHTWHRVSTDGYYAIDHELNDVDQVTGFECFHIPALWASAESIGRADTLQDAEKLCNEHATRPRAA
jgi:hypothetical protein